MLTLFLFRFFFKILNFEDEHRIEMKKENHFHSIYKREWIQQQKKK